MNAHVPRLTDRPRDLLVHAIRTHVRGDRGHCLCGWGEPGLSHAEHVVEVFEADLEHLRARETAEARRLADEREAES